MPPTWEGRRFSAVCILRWNTELVLHNSLCFYLIFWFLSFSRVSFNLESLQAQNRHNQKEELYKNFRMLSFFPVFEERRPIFNRATLNFVIVWKHKLLFRADNIWSEKCEWASTNKGKLANYYNSVHHFQY